MNGFPSHEGTSMAKNMKDGSYKQSFENTPLEQKVVKEGEGQDQNKIFNEKGNHVANWVDGKKVAVASKKGPRVTASSTIAKQKTSKSGVVTTRTANSITKSKGNKTSTFNMDKSKTKKNRDGSTSYTFTNADNGASITENHSSAKTKKTS